MSLRSFLGSRTGKNFFNVCYCWGACLVILGAVLKIMHAPYDNLFLMIGLWTEVFIFFISGFDEPTREYKWERVYPALNEKTKNGNADTTAINTGNAANNKAIEELNKKVDALNGLYINKLNEMYEMQIKQLKNGTASTETQESARKLANEIAQLNENYKKMLNTLN